MQVDALPLATPRVAHFQRQGIKELYPPQAETVASGICDGENVMAAIPTASGKTLIAQLAMLTADGPGLYIVPLRALATEKHATFSELPGVDVGVATGDYDSPATELAEHDIVVATSEKVDSAIRNGASWVDDIGCVVVDEVHLLGQTDRGPTLEVTLAHLRRLTPGVQLVALSATVANAAEIADWLGATLVESDWRPVDLRTGVADAAAVTYDDTTKPIGIDGEDLPPDAELDTETTARLVNNAIADGGQSLAFVRSRREAESLADRLCDDTDDTTTAQRETIASEIETLDGTVTGQRLADCVRDGVAFHHAGLRSGHRAIIESAFRDRRLDAICATPTLAAGVNVPARRVVVRDQQRYTGSGTEWLPVLEIHQMCGRAGRPHLDPYGEAILVDTDNPDELAERYLAADPEAVESKLASEAALRTHVLSIIASEFAETETGILDVLAATFYAHQTPVADLTGIVGAVIDELIEMALVVRKPAGGDDDTEGEPSAGVLVATEIGATVSTQYITPETGVEIADGLRTAEGMAEPSMLTALEIICATPDMHDTYLGNEERATIYEYARRHAAEFTTAMDEADDFERWLEAIKTARILAEWSEGATIETLVERYRLGPGDLDSRIERADWLLGAADAIADVLGVPLPAISRLRTRL